VDQKVQEAGEETGELKWHHRYEQIELGSPLENDKRKRRES
jgi:hypothetical protein